MKSHIASLSPKKEFTFASIPYICQDWYFNLNCKGLLVINYGILDSAPQIQICCMHKSR